ncbi:MAG: PqqD family peptide modification chaperone, partial [Planctomycetales bacterium]|nr:PqqD family peptide modification chaperone [Planctomycetales bacterium]
MFQRDRPYTRSAIRAVSVDSGWLVYDCERDVVHRLNPTAALILTLCDGNHTVQQIEAAVALAQNQRPDARPAMEVQTWLAQAA